MIMTSRQSSIFNFIKNHVQEKGYSPSVREMCEGVGLKSTSTLHGHLERMERHGLIKRNKSKSRAIEIVESDRLRVAVRVLEKAADGTFEKIMIGGHTYVRESKG